MLGTSGRQAARTARAARERARYEAVTSSRAQYELSMNCVWEVPPKPLRWAPRWRPRGRGNCGRLAWGLDHADSGRALKRHVPAHGVEPLCCDERPSAKGQWDCDDPPRGDEQHRKQWNMQQWGDERGQGGAGPTELFGYSAMSSTVVPTCSGLMDASKGPRNSEGRVKFASNRSQLNKER